MASMQQAQSSAAQISDKDRAAIDELMKEAKSAMVNNSNNCSQIQLAKVAGIIRNADHQLPIQLYRNHDWQGKFAVFPSKTIESNARAKFVHEGATSQGHLPVVVGSKAAVVYGQSQLGRPRRGWLLAWCKPDNANERTRVYVEAGHYEKLMKMEWCEVEKKLDASSNQSCSRDPDSGARALAEIKDGDNKEAVLSAIFDVIPAIGIDPPCPCPN